MAKPAAPASPPAPGSRTLNEAIAGSTQRGLRSPLASSAVQPPTPAASPAFTLLRRARDESATRSARWTWQAPQASVITEFDDAGYAWLVRLVQAARGRWVDVADSAGPQDALEVRWWRDGWPHATLRIEAGGLRWIEASGRVRYAPLEAASLQRLRAL